MIALFTFADYSEPDWGAIDLCDDGTSYRKFWAAVLQFATADQADAVLYDLDRGDECLATVIGDETYPMDPPPVEYRDDLLVAARHLAASRPPLGAVHFLLRIFGLSHYLGKFEVQLPEHTVSWSVYGLSNGLSIQRLVGVA